MFEIVSVLPLTQIVRQGVYGKIKSVPPQFALDYELLISTPASHIEALFCTSRPVKIVSGGHDNISDGVWQIGTVSYSLMSPEYVWIAQTDVYECGADVASDTLVRGGEFVCS